MTQLSRQDGFTLIEILIAMSMAVIIFVATMGLLIVYIHGSTASTERTGAQDQARLAVDRIAQQLRNIASPLSSPKLIERDASYDLVFQTIATPSGSNTTGAERVRYCVPNDSASGSTSLEEMYSQTQTWTTATAPSVPWSTTACPDTSPSDANSATDGSAKYTVVAPYIMNRYKQTTGYPIFYYNDSTTPPSDISDVTSLQIDLRVNPTPPATTAASELKSGVYLRNQLQEPVANFTATATGNGGVLLNAGTSYSPDGQYLSFKWACSSSSSSCPSSSTLTGASDALIFWSPGAGTYSVQVTVTDPTGLSDTYTGTVTVT